MDANELVEGFTRYVSKPDGDGCWGWTSITTNGYGRLYVRGDRWIAAHRLAYMLSRGLSSLPDSRRFFVCHRCNNPGCVNPAHLYLGTPKDNTSDMIRSGHHRNARKTHCKQGHAFSKQNTQIDCNGRRVCRTCLGRWRQQEAAARQKKIERGICEHCDSPRVTKRFCLPCAVAARERQRKRLGSNGIKTSLTRRLEAA